MVRVRQARADDREDVVAFTEDTWSDRGVGDYIPDVFAEWIETDGPDQHTVVAAVDGTAVGVCQVVLLSDEEAWAQGMRVHPDHRGAGVATTLADACADWARERGATVMRNMVFGWNTAGLGAARAAGFDPVTEFRWAHLDPDPDASSDDVIADDTDAAWRFWRDSDAAAHLQGLGLDGEESWALSEVTRGRFRRAAAETALLAVEDAGGVRAAAYRVRDYERETDDGGERWAEYGVGAWTDLSSAGTLFGAIGADAAALGADRTRVLIPETARFVSDAVRTAGSVGEHPDFVLARDLTATRR